MESEQDPLPFLHLCQRCPLSALSSRPPTRHVRGEAGVPLEDLGRATLGGRRVVFLGEAPGEVESRVGRPFVGPAGKLLRSTLLGVGIDPLDVYITNPVRCRPPGNRTPTAGELRVCCDNWLWHELDVLRPDLIVACGATPAKALFGQGVKAQYVKHVGQGRPTKASPLGKPKLKELTLGELRRRDDLTVQVGARTVPVIAAFHPSAALRMAKNMAPFMRDMQRVAAYLGVERKKVEGEVDLQYQEIAPQISGVTLQLQPVVSIDTEFDKLEGLGVWSFSFTPGEAYVIYHYEHPEFSRQWMRLLISQCEQIVAYSAAADVPQICTELGMDLRDWPHHKTRDPMVAAYNLGWRPLGLKDLVTIKLGLEVVLLKDLFEEGKTIRQIVEEIGKPAFTRYSGQDADLALRLHYKEMQEMERLDG